MSEEREICEKVAKYLDIKVGDFFKRKNKVVGDAIKKDSMLYGNFRAWAFNRFNCCSWLKVYSTGKKTVWLFYQYLKEEKGI